MRVCTCEPIVIVALSPWVRSWTVEKRIMLSPLVLLRLTDLSIDLQTSQFVSA